jgi:hypothetical protein
MSQVFSQVNLFWQETMGQPWKRGSKAGDTVTETRLALTNRNAVAVDPEHCLSLIDFPTT